MTVLQSPRSLTSKTLGLLKRKGGFYTLDGHAPIRREIASKHIGGLKAKGHPVNEN